MTEEKQSSHSGFKTFLVLILILITSGALYVVLYGDTGNLFADETQEVQDAYSSLNPNNSNLTTLAIEIDAAIANVEITYLPEASSNKSIQANWVYRYGISSHNDQDPITITIDFLIKK